MSKLRCTTFAVTRFIYPTSYLLAMGNVLLRDIRKFNEMENLDHEKESQGQLEEKWDLRQSTGNVRFHISDFCPEF